MRGFLRFFTFLVRGNESLLDTNKDVITKYNYNTLKIFTLIYSLISVFFQVISFLPFFPLYSRTVYKIFFAAFLFNFVLLYCLCKFFKKYVSSNVLPFIYVFNFVLFTWGLIFNLAAEPAEPYTLTLCFLMIIPIIFIDRPRRILITGIFSYLIAILFSFLFKDWNLFLTDVINTSMFLIIGLILGNVTRSYQIRYIDMKAHKLDKDLEVMKAKSEAKSSFLANMSHEIRTPINAILGLNEMVLRESGEQQILQYAQDIKISGKTLLALINDILDFSKIEANKLDIIPAEYALDSLITDLVNMLTPRARAKNLEFKLIVDETIPNTLYGDEVRIKQCIMNILTNGIKYTNEGSVTFKVGWESISSRNMLLKVEVADTGIGIKEEDIPKLFAAFRRIDEKRNRNVEGTGLGMSIVLGLLEKMGSTLYVKSEYGKGSKFWFNLQQEIVSSRPIGKIQDRMTASENVQSLYVEAFHAPDARILVIDDMKINLSVIQGLLKKTKIQIDTCLSGEESLDLVQKNKYDLIFIDHRMPVMDGIETLHAMQKLGRNLSWKAPCIALTANAISGARAMYLNEGFADYLSKPVDFVKLEQLLVNYLPKEKVLKVDSSAVKTEPDKEPCQVQKNEAEQDFTIENRIFFTNCCKTSGIDAQKALANCGDVEVLKTAIAEYYRTIDEKANLIEKYANEHDYKNYTILVHALKSSSRLIGAMELSQMAAFLEQAGDKKSFIDIDAKTPNLLKLYRGYKQNLRHIASLAGDADIDYQKQEEKGNAFATVEAIPEINEDEWNDALAAIDEYKKGGDLVSVQNLIEMLKCYNLSNDKLDLLRSIEIGGHYNG